MLALSREFIQIKLGLRKFTKTPRKILPAGVARVLKRLHYPSEVILPSVRWYVAHWLSLRDL